MAGCNNVLGINTPFVRSSLAEDEQDQIPSEAANTDMTTVSPTPPPIHQLTTSITSDPYAVMFLSPPARSTSDIFDHQYPNIQVEKLHEKSTFGTLPSNNLGSGFCNRYTYENASHSAKTRIVFMESSPKETPPKLPRRTLSTTNSTSGHFTSSYM